MHRYGLHVTVIFAVLFSFLILSCSDDPVSSVSTGTITGKVTNSTDNSPIAQASITTNPATSAVTTDANGSFILDDVTDGEITITATKSGFISGSVRVLVLKEKTIEANIVLNPTPTSNKAPESPSQATPENNAVNQPVALTLSWTCTDPDEDSLSYDVYAGNGNSSIQKISADQQKDSLLIENLDYNTTYFWQIVAKDGNGAETYGPVWSFTTIPLPNNRIVFSSNRDGNYEIYSASENGENVIRLTDHPGRDWCPKLSPNGNKIAFTSDRDIDNHIYMMNRDGSGVTKTTTIPVTSYNNNGTGFCWSPDGRQLLYAHNDVLYRINADGTNLTSLATAPAGSHFKEMAWSSLGNKIAAITTGSDVYATQLYILDSNGANITLLVDDNPGAMGHPTFSPDGQKIAYFYDVSGHQVNTGRQLNSKIFIMHIDSTSAKDVSGKKTDGTNDIDPTWSPDGAKIIFTNLRNDNSEPGDIWIMDIDGENREQLIENGRMPDWN